MRQDLPFVDRARLWTDRIALADGKGTYTFADLLASSERGAARLLSGREDLGEARVAFMVEPSYRYVVAQ